MGVCSRGGLYCSMLSMKSRTNRCDTKCMLHLARHMRVMQVSFYGLKADAAMAASVFEVAYNIVLDMGKKKYGNQGKSRSIMSYR